MSALLDNGLEVTALHNHFYWEEPRLAYMHVHGHGDPMDLARRVKPALDLIGKGAPPAAAAPAGAALPPALDGAKLAAIVGTAGVQTGAVYKITLARPDLKITEMGAPINSRMGLNTWASFVGTNDKAAIAGDIAMKAAEDHAGAQGAAGARPERGRHPSAHDDHRSDDLLPALPGTGPAADLATGFKAAVDQTGK